MTRSTSSVLPVTAALKMLTDAYAATEFSAWQPVTPDISCSARHETTAVAVDEILYLIGGSTNGHWNGFVPWLDSLDLKTGQWNRLPDAPHARDHFQDGLVDGRIIAAGGRRTHEEEKLSWSPIETN